LFAARYKSGKTLLLNDLMDSVSSGQPFPDRPTKSSRLLWMQLEDPAKTIARRWLRRHPSGTMPTNISVDRGPCRLTVGNLDTTIQALVDSQTNLLVVDPLILAQTPHRTFDPTESRDALALHACTMR